MRTLLLFALLCGLPLLLAAQKSDPSQYEGTRAGLIELLQDLPKLSKKARIQFGRKLRPAPADYKAVFTQLKYAEEVWNFHRRLYSTSAFTVQPLLPEQTDILLWEAKQADFVRYTGQAAYFPGGYHEIAQLLSPDFTYYRMKYVQPGKNTGSAYEMFVYVNGSWRFFPRPWAVGVGEF